MAHNHSDIISSNVTYRDVSPTFLEPKKPQSIILLYIHKGYQHRYVDMPCTGDSIGRPKTQAVGYDRGKDYHAIHDHICKSAQVVSESVPLISGCL